MKNNEISDIILYGAFDRHNYGDLLFPLIMHRVISKHRPELNIEVAGLIDSDLSQFGAPKTVAIKKALKHSKEDACLILAGGDVVACDWTSAYSYLMPRLVFPIFERVSERFFPKFADKALAKLAGLSSDFPFNIDQTEIGPKRKVIYNAVGATAVSNLKGDVAEKLYFKMQSASYLSVRDLFGQDHLTSIGCKDVNLAPDSATLMSSYITPEELALKTSASTSEMIEILGNNYLVFQISHAHLGNNAQAFAQQLSELQATTGLAIVFIAIGNAAGHNDSQAIQELCSLLNQDVSHSSYLDGNIFDLMNIIRNSSCYCGTSLHGLITSMSFSVPRVALLPRLRKQINYMKTWDLPNMPRGIEPENLVQAVDTALAIPIEQLNQLSETLNATYLESFEQMSQHF